MDYQEGGLSSLNSTLVKKIKWNLERAYEGGWWITLFTISHYGTYIYRGDFMDSFVVFYC